MTLTPLNAIRERAEKARKLVEAASSVPWCQDRTGFDVVHYESEDDDDPMPVQLGTFWSAHDAALAAASPTLVRELLDDNERLRKAVELLQAQRNAWIDTCELGERTTDAAIDRYDAELAAILEPKVTP